MSAFLWVEDFENGQYQEFTNNIFGRAFGLNVSEIPHNENSLRRYLEDRDIYLVSTFSEADYFIENRLADIDFVILDIDLKVLDEYSEDTRPTTLTSILSNWYNYKADDLVEEKSFTEACDKLKPEAGYHIWKNLVMRRGFPRDRILFCSNHAGYLESINKSFHGAKIESPDIYEKRDSKVGEWVCNNRSVAYTALRREVITACREVAARLISQPSIFRLPNTIMRDPPLDANNANILLDTLPLLLPPDAGLSHQRVAFRLLARTLAQDWDKHVNIKEFESTSEKSMATVIKAARNFTSHDGDALSQLSEADVAFLFLICFRMTFTLSFADLEKFETNMMEIIGPKVKLSDQNLQNCLNSSIQNINDLFNKLRGHEKIHNNTGDAIEYFDGKVNALQEAGKLSPTEQMKCLKLVFLQRMFTSGKSSRFDPPKRLSKFVECLCERMYESSCAPLEQVLPAVRAT